MEQEKPRKLKKFKIRRVIEFIMHSETKEKLEQVLYPGCEIIEEDI